MTEEQTALERKILRRSFAELDNLSEKAGQAMLAIESRRWSIIGDYQAYKDCEKVSKFVGDEKRILCGVADPLNPPLISAMSDNPLSKKRVEQ